MHDLSRVLGWPKKLLESSSVTESNKTMHHVFDKQTLVFFIANFHVKPSGKGVMYMWGSL